MFCSIQEISITLDLFLQKVFMSLKQILKSNVLNMVRLEQIPFHSEKFETRPTCSSS